MIELTEPATPVAPPPNHPAGRRLMIPALIVSVLLVASVVAAVLTPSGHASAPRPARLLYAGGPVVTDAYVHAIYWIPPRLQDNRRTSFTKLEIRRNNEFLHGLPGTGYFDALKRLPRGPRFQQMEPFDPARDSFVTHAAYPRGDCAVQQIDCIPSSALIPVVGEAARRMHWPIISNAIIVVYLDPAEQFGLCSGPHPCDGWHEPVTWLGAVTFTVAAIGNEGTRYASSGLDEVNRYASWYTAHELVEALSDPVPPRGWHISPAPEHRDEIADFCEGQVGEDVLAARYPVPAYTVDGRSCVRP